MTVAMLVGVFNTTRGSVDISGNGNGDDVHPRIFYTLSYYKK